jgi:hypothetical protein
VNILYSGLEFVVSGCYNLVITPTHHRLHPVSSSHPPFGSFGEGGFVWVIECTTRVMFLCAEAELRAEVRFMSVR